MRMFNSRNGSENGNRANGYRKPARYSALDLIGHGLSGSDWPRAWHAHDLKPSYDVVIVGGGDPALKGAPTGWVMPVREVRASVGAGLIYPICGDMRTMPGLSAHPAAEGIDIDERGEIVGLS